MPNEECRLKVNFVLFEGFDFLSSFKDPLGFRTNPFGSLSFELFSSVLTVSLFEFPVAAVEQFCST
jgi:hypothetical protein